MSNTQLFSEPQTKHQIISNAPINKNKHKTKHKKSKCSIFRRHFINFCIFSLSIVIIYYSASSIYGQVVTTGNDGTSRFSMPGLFVNLFGLGDRNKEELVTEASKRKFQDYDYIDEDDISQSKIDISNVKHGRLKHKDDNFENSLYQISHELTEILKHLKKLPI